MNRLQALQNKIGGWAVGLVEECQQRLQLLVGGKGSTFPRFGCLHFLGVYWGRLAESNLCISGCNVFPLQSGCFLRAATCPKQEFYPMCIKRVLSLNGSDDSVTLGRGEAHIGKIIHLLPELFPQPLKGIEDEQIRLYSPIAASV
ncbi:hypothetical protein C7B61_01795 [filamentous cyanobacterium CCP1]|nr:hypothetical protein C7B76_12275 [filamentous cyanobacterium CCP2]PSB68259.1 hypothetical protein C7B61_01795 [filamentous cyanobacterium CCP1]